MRKADHDQQDEEGFGFLADVLAAEQKAAARVAAAQAVAGQIVQSAQAEARRISERADRRVQTLHHCHKAAVESAAAEMRAAFEAERAAVGAGAGDADIAVIAARLARKLTGCGPA